MASRLQAGPNGQLIDPGSGRVLGFRDLAGNEFTLPSILAQSAIPTILLSAATNISANGAITGLTALGYTPVGVVRVYCFAQAGLAAGLYYATFGSATACQLFSDAAATITPTGITPGAYASGTSKVPLQSMTLPGGSMGANGALRSTVSVSCPNTAGNKYCELQLGGVGISGSTLNFASSTAGAFDRILRNENSQSVNKWIGSSAQYTSSGSGGVSNVRTAINTAVDQLFTINAQLATTADYMILEGYTIEVLPGV